MLAFGPKCGCPLRHSPVLVGRQIGRMVSVIGTLSLSLNRAMSWSKFIKLKSPVKARNTNRLSGFFVSLQRSCSPNVTLIMNHINLLVQIIITLYIQFLFDRVRRQSLLRRFLLTDIGSTRILDWLSGGELQLTETHSCSGRLKNRTS